MSLVSFSGLASGLDTDSIVSALLAARRQPIVRLQERQSSFQKQIKALEDLKTKLLAVQTAAKAMDTTNEFGALKATVSDADRLGVSVTSLAAPGNYDIVVNNLATYQKDGSQGFADLTTDMGTGTFTITVGGETTEITLEAGTSSLADLRDAINDSDAAVNATILNDGSDGTPYRLILTSAESGADAAFTYDFGGLGGGTAPTMSSIQAAVDASFSIDSIPITSSSNVIGDAITGMTFTLQNADPDTTINVAVTTDEQAITETVKELVDAYNDLMAFVTTQSAEGGTLRGNNTLRTVADRIQTLFTMPLADPAGGVSMLAHVGITLTEGRQLEFDTTAFKEALGTGFSDVRDLFVERGDNLGKAYLIRTSIEDLTSSVNGLFKISTDALNDQVDHMDDTIERYERSLESYEMTLRRRFTAMESMVAALQSQGSYLSSVMSGMGMM
jgi:flagellar hook-associated protein 2